MPLWLIYDKAATEALPDILLAIMLIACVKSIPVRVFTYFSHDKHPFWEYKLIIIRQILVLILS